MNFQLQQMKFMQLSQSPLALTILP